VLRTRATEDAEMRRSDDLELEGSDEVLEIDDFVVAAEEDADGVEADLGVARDRAA
jgi:hypothetical protein